MEFAGGIGESMRMGENRQEQTQLVGGGKEAELTHGSRRSSEQCAGNPPPQYLEAPLNGTRALAITYSASSNCQWVIRSPAPGLSVPLAFTEFNVDSFWGHDFVYIAARCGRTKLTGAEGVGRRFYSANGAKLSVRLTSHSSIQGTGFAAVYSAIPTNSVPQPQVPSTAGYKQDDNALRALYTSMDGPNWSMQSLWMGECNHCSWEGVTCAHDAMRRVTACARQFTGKGGGCGGWHRWPCVRCAGHVGD